MYAVSKCFYGLLYQFIYMGVGKWWNCLISMTHVQREDQHTVAMKS